MAPKVAVDPRILALCEKVTSKRPRTVIDHILKHGFITTEDLQTKYGYDHPPRAIRDVRENGVPLETFKVESDRTGRKIAAYRFGDPAEIRRGRIGGRSAFSKQFKEELVQKYGSADAITGQKMDARYLQIDHRVPYEVSGDGDHDETDLDAYMLLDASSQRAKSWSCEHCENWTSGHDEQVCERCYWAYPEKYTHVAMKAIRRADITWSGEREVREFESLAREAARQGLSVSDFIKKLAKNLASKGK